MNYIIYKHINKINYKIYIGITCQNPYKRWNSGNGYKKQSRFYNAIKKYGWNNFEHIVLFNNLTKKEACEIEVELISFHKSNEEDFGYNQSYGGDCGAVGVKCKDSIKKYLREKNGIKIICLENKSIFDSIKHAGKELNINYRHISRVLKNKRKTAGGFHFMYLDDYNNNIEYVLKDGITKPKRIICIETKEVFNSITDASVKMNLDLSGIAKACKNHKSVKSFHFMYLKDYSEKG